MDHEVFLLFLSENQNKVSIKKFLRALRGLRGEKFCLVAAMLHRGDYLTLFRLRLFGIMYNKLETKND